MIDSIYIARHGAYYASNNNIVELNPEFEGFRLNWVTTAWTSPTGTPRDPPLAAFGESQAQELAAHFLTLPEDERPTGVWCSPYLAKALGLPIYIEHGIGEWYSPTAPGTGLHPRPGPAASLTQFFPDTIDTSWESIYYVSRKGEPVDALYERCKGFLQDFLSLEEVHKKHKKILFVSHAATVIGLTRELIGDRRMPLRVGCASLTTVTSGKGNGEVGRWEVGQEKLADASFLTGGVQRDWGMEDIVIDPESGEVVDDHGVPGTEGDGEGLVGSQVAKLGLKVLHGQTQGQVIHTSNL
uniref:Phosphoglycerate mutase-like protein n=1 Tax=Moniliophthora roreri TaxID=221103 RepID=A0A0W0G2G5_MONRR